MTSFLWTYTDLATVKLGYLYGLFDYDALETRLAAIRAENDKARCDSDRSGDRRCADLADRLVVSGVKSDD